MERVRSELGELRRGEASNYLVTGPYLGLTFGLTMGALRALRQKQAALNQSSLRIILRTATTYSIAGLAYGLAGYYLTSYYSTESKQQNEAISFKNRFLAGGIAGLSMGLVERRLGFGLLCGVLFGGVAVLERAITTLDLKDFRIVPVKPPPM